MQYGVRLGSYSTRSISPAIPSLFRLKSINTIKLFMTTTTMTDSNTTLIIAAIPRFRLLTLLLLPLKARKDVLCAIRFRDVKTTNRRPGEVGFALTIRHNYTLTPVKPEKSIAWPSPTNYIGFFPSLLRTQTFVSPLDGWLLMFTITILASTLDLK